MLISEVRNGCAHLQVNDLVVMKYRELLIEIDHNAMMSCGCKDTPPSIFMQP